MGDSGAVSAVPVVLISRASNFLPARTSLAFILGLILLPILFATAFAFGVATVWTTGPAYPTLSVDMGNRESFDLREVCLIPFLDFMNGCIFQKM